MRGRRSSRSAAVVLAGCVGLAVMAPGLALATPASGVTTEVDCEAAGYTWTAAGCDDGTTATEATTPSSATEDPAGGTTTTPRTVDTTTPSSEAPATVVVPSPDEATSRTAPAGTGRSGGEETTPPPRDDPSSVARTVPAVPATAQTLAAGGDQLVAELAALPIDLPETFVPGSGNIPLDLPFEIPTEVPEGGFTNPQEACAFLVSGLNAAPDQSESLGTAFSQFCGALPQEFGAFDPNTLIEDLLGLLEGLINAFPTPGAGHIPNIPPSYVPVDYWGYWHEQYDVDCPELTYEEANAILAWDRSDPFDLDRDKDGEACERNAHGDRVEYIEYVEYDSYPVGGVATGDGSTDPGASDLEVALAAGALSGLGVTGLVLVRRFARQG